MLKCPPRLGTLQSVLTHWARDKWTSFRRRHFQVHHLERKYLNSDLNFTEVCSSGSNQQFLSIGLDNGLAAQATSHYLNQWWLVYRRIYASLGLNELTRHLSTAWATGKHQNQNTKLRDFMRSDDILSLYGKIAFNLCGQDSNPGVTGNLNLPDLASSW